MTRDWKPGDVAVAKWAGGSVRGIIETDGRFYTTDQSVAGVSSSAFAISNLRPLVVIDPEDRAQVERLIRAQIGSRAGCPDALIVADAQVDGMQAALRSLIEPPRPPEPTGLGAVARSGDTGALVRVTPSTEPGLWVNSRLPDEVLPWDGISLPLTVLSEGVTQ